MHELLVCKTTLPEIFPLADNPAGYSDERLILEFGSVEWSNSTTYNGTPGAANSVSPKEYDLAITNLKVTPDLVVEGSPVDMNITITNPGLKNAQGGQTLPDPS